MKKAYIEQLEAARAGCLNSIITEFLFTRLLARQIGCMQQNYWSFLGPARRQVVKLKQSPFNAHRAESIRVLLREGDKQCDELGVAQRQLGEALVKMAPEFDAATTFEQRCELLGVNVVDRAQLPADSGMVHIASAYGLEDSAAGRSLPHKSGPLCGAIQAHMNHIMFTTPEGRAAMDEMWEKLTEPGGLFQGLPLYDKDADGTMVRRPPNLVVVTTPPADKTGGAQ
ncbi:MAG: hypothetical protein ACOH2S_27500 [Janthinobacterium svalbardensis]|uniref:Uncharacterized protein n=1 Tax=Janthinobacterium svalbardensis TaxID=368607 RepID=A0A290X051_9BURK|nr:hypothetical protein [Janthinobacterium svalbardensis]ATD62525.1 hypothetical protein CNX70_22020 [Janthinobacterium svalbardensis]